MGRRSVERETAELLRRLLEAIDRGQVEANGPRAIALRRRIEGAIAALEAAAARR